MVTFGFGLGRSEGSRRRGTWLAMMYADGNVASFDSTENSVQPKVRVDSLDCGISDSKGERSFGVVRGSARFADWK